MTNGSLMKVKNIAECSATRASINFQIQEVQTSYPWNLEVPLNFFGSPTFFLWYRRGVADCQTGFEI